MPVFDILCLAASYKRRGLCVAGLRTDGGGWIRPCAPSQYGELYPEHYVLDPGGAPRVLDVIRIPFVGPQPEPHHPENWLIADEPWQLIHRGLPTNLAPLVAATIGNDPALLGNYAGAISFLRLQEHPAKASLALIEPTNLQWLIEETRSNPRKPRAHFKLGSRVYRLPVTDPIYIPTFRTLPPGTYPVNKIGIDQPARVLLTVSLGEPFDNDYCYKLVTAIIPLAPSVLNRPAAPMDREEAAWVLEALVRGNDPYSGDPLPPASPLANPDNRKALRTALAALRGNGDKTSRPPRPLPEYDGQPWRSEKDKPNEPAIVHGCTRGVIGSWLTRLGKIVG